uniref:Male-specific lethal 1 homolog n=1 Tax=Phallusia mammillata TaxID=59560 RepID=A0A6F9DLH0_9ASCI|nr:male-specific lethal 1 homolog [Phallusia mammillata]
MTAKPMPRICAGMSGNHVMSVPSNKHLLPIGTNQSKNLMLSSEVTKSENHVSTQVNIIAQVPDAAQENSLDLMIEGQAGLQNDETAVASSVSTLVSKQIKSSDLPIPMQSTVCADVDNVESEIQRCKELMMLQVSLISRQQDLLKLRDKEIMQLKAGNQSLKCRLERMERRISLSRKNNRQTKPFLSKLNEAFDSDKLNDGKRPRTALIDVDSTVDDDSNIKDGKTNLQKESPPEQVQKDQSPEFESRCIPTTVKNSVNSDNVSTTNDELKTASKGTLSSLKSPNEPSCFPVPVSFIERCQNQLLSSILSSPIVAVKNTEVFSPTSTNQETESSRFAFKICDRCPHCIAMATEITRLLSISNNADKVSPQSKKDGQRPISPSHQPLLKVSNIITNVKEGTSDWSELRTSNQYYRQFCLSSLNCPSNKDEHCDDGSTLNIPTWRICDVKCTNTNLPSADFELTDDDTYYRRHTKFETAEKRRKRWDIQRIREFRYNEKLRQKLLKQERQEEGTLETFIPTLYDIDAVEIEDTLPINAFGHSLPLIIPQEFSMESQEPS